MTSLFQPETVVRMLDRHSLLCSAQIPLDVSVFIVRLDLLFDHANQQRNASEFLNCSVNDAQYEENQHVRTITIAQQQATMHVLLLSNRTKASQVQATATSASCNVTVSFRFHLLQVKRTQVHVTLPRQRVADYDAPQVAKQQVSDVVRLRLSKLFDYAIGNLSQLNNDEDLRLLQQHQSLLQLARNGSLLRNGFIRKLAPFVSMKDDTEKFPQRKLLAVQSSHSFLPWENQHVFDHLLLSHSHDLLRPTRFGRTLLADSFGDSLKHVNKLFNR